MKKTACVFFFFPQRFLNFLWKVGRCVQLEETDGRKVGVKSAWKTMRRKKEQTELCFFAGCRAISVSAARGMLGKWVIRSCAGFSGCSLITQRAENRWRHHRLSPSLSVGWRNVRACPVWPPLPSAGVLFESGSAVTLDLSEKSAAPNFIHSLTSIPSYKLESNNCSSWYWFWGSRVGGCRSSSFIFPKAIHDLNDCLEKSQ